MRSPDAGVNEAVNVMIVVQLLLVLVVPLATAVLFGAVAERLGARAMTGLVAMCGLGLGVYFLNYALALVAVR